MHFGRGGRGGTVSTWRGRGERVEGGIEARGEEGEQGSGG